MFYTVGNYASYSKAFVSHAAEDGTIIKTGPRRVGDERFPEGYEGGYAVRSYLDGIRLIDSVGMIDKWIPFLIDGDWDKDTRLSEFIDRGEWWHYTTRDLKIYPNGGVPDDSPPMRHTFAGNFQVMIEDCNETYSLVSALLSLCHFGCSGTVTQSGDTIVVAGYNPFLGLGATVDNSFITGVSAGPGITIYSLKALWSSTSQVAERDEPANTSDREPMSSVQAKEAQYHWRPMVLYSTNPDDYRSAEIRSFDPSMPGLYRPYKAATTQEATP